MCGLFGFSGDPKIIDRNIARAVQAKIKMLGLYNIERGKHSCGIYIGGTIIKGVNEDKLFNDFIQNNQLPEMSTTGNFVVIGHTRQATHGTHTIENTHPFNVNDQLILAHNGTIRNIWGMCGKYGVDHSKIHVDSLALAHIINKEGFKVLNEYEGFAALLMTKPSEPNSLYAYRGVSRRIMNGLMEEERPLFYMKSEEGIYFSSLEKSLLAISDIAGEEIKQLEGNVVHKITNGKMTKAKFAVNREAINIGVSAVTNYNNVNANTPKTTGVGQTTGATTPTPTTTTNAQVASSYPAPPSMTEKHVPIAWHETLPSRIDKYTGYSGVFYQQSRYWIVKDEEIKLAHGVYLITKRGFVTEQEESQTMTYYFYEGVMMRNEKVYNEALKDPDLKNSDYNFAFTISKYSEFPVCNLRSDVYNRCKAVGIYLTHRWFENGHIMKNKSITPKFSDRNYVIRDGLLVSITIQPNSGNPNEACIDGQTFGDELAKLTKKDEELPAPIPTLTLPQRTLPFKDEIPEEDVTNFYRVYDSVENARETLVMLEINALRYYVCDIMTAEMGVEPETIFEDVVDVQLNMFLSQCCETNSTIIELLDDKNYQDIFYYLRVARENPNGIYTEYPVVDTLPDCEACEFVPKHPMVPSSEEISERIKQVTEDIQAITVETVDDAFPPDEEEPMIDKAIRSEHASVLADEDKEDELYVEEVEREETIEYAIQDTVDFMKDTRDAADTLVTFDDDFCQEAANLIYRTTDPFMSALKSLCEQHGEKEFLNYIRKSVEAKADI